MKSQPGFQLLFVCLGNICRSPAADGVLRHKVQDLNWTDRVFVDSAGTGAWHVGEPPDARMIAQARGRGYDLSKLRARQFDPKKDFAQFDLILTMDKSNLHNVRALSQNAASLARVRPMTDFCKTHNVKEVPDPYYKGDDGFEYVLDLIEDASEQILHHIRERLK